MGEIPGPLWKGNSDPSITSIRTRPVISVQAGIQPSEAKQSQYELRWMSTFHLRGAGIRGEDDPEQTKCRKPNL